MATQSVEVQTLNECYSTIVSCVQTSPESIADRLRALLSPQVVAFLRNPHHDNDDKARRILDSVIERVSVDKEAFSKFLKALEDDGGWTKSTLKEIRDTYKKLKPRTPEYRALLKHEQRIVKTWKEEISKGHTHTIQQLHRECTLKRPTSLKTSPETVGEYLTSVLESVGEDSRFYHDFLSDLKALGKWGESCAEEIEATKEEFKVGKPALLVSRETQTIMPLPPKLQVHVPIHCATIKATPYSEHTTPTNDEKFTLQVTIKDAATNTPVDCIVGLHGNTRVKCKGQVACFLSLRVTNAVSVQPKHPKNELYKIWRSKKSGYVANGQVIFRMCFYEADANYIVTLGVASVIDEEEIECAGYTVEHYTGFVSTFRTVERGAFKAPPKKRYEGEIASPKFNKIMSVYHKMFYEGQLDSSNMIMDKMTAEGSTAVLDIKLYMRLIRATEKTFDPQTITELEDILRKSRSMSCRNSFLLEGEITMALSQIHALQGRQEKALQYTHQSRSICLEAVPSHLTSCVYFNNARSLIHANKGNITPEIKQRILELFDRAIADSYYGVGWERMMIYNGHVYKALFCLNGIIDISIQSQRSSSWSYSPTSEDISLAEQHLEAAPLDGVNDQHMHIIIYNIAMSDLHRWKGDKSLAREYVEKAKSLCVEKSYYTSGMIKALDTRLELLGPDTMDEVLEMFAEVKV